MYFYCGFMLAVIRITEPFVYKSLKYRLKKLFGIKKGKKVKQGKKGYEALSLCQFTHSAMNIEFTSLILVGINKFMEDVPLLMDHSEIG